VFLCKNTNSAVLAEKYYGTDKTIKNFVYLGVSKGLGCGAVVNDHLITGANGFACELGHISVNPEGPLCSCGNRGCLAGTDGFCEGILQSGIMCFQITEIVLK
jgi:glucokinase